ncbi:MAG: hypothetical protein EBU90_03830 [Proteobacteria bacterium]|nr:hypothetical protein [Pseudomonadota bacterium]NBP14198.1 hypothetical protein [bacterium]
MSSAKYPKIQFKRATEAEFVANSTVLASGEPAWATDSKTLKIGDGSTNWSALSGVATAGGVPANLVYSTTTGIGTASGVTNIVQISQSGFNNLGSYSPSTVYLIVS